MYDKIQPVYGIALVGSNYFDDKRPVRSFVISDSETGQALKLSFDNSKQLRTPFEMVIVELKKTWTWKNQCQTTAMVGIFR